MAKEALEAGLEESATTQVVTEKKVKALPTAEEIKALEQACEKIRQFGVSDEFARTMKMVPMWDDKEANKPVKDEVIASFGGSETFKTYVDGPFQDELAVIAGLGKTLSILNNVKSFYARREGTSPKSKKAKMSAVNINNTPYLVNAEYLASLSSYTKDEKRELLLAHADTRANDTIESL